MGRKAQSFIFFVVELCCFPVQCLEDSRFCTISGRHSRCPLDPLVCRHLSDGEWNKLNLKHVAAELFLFEPHWILFMVKVGEGKRAMWKTDVFKKSLKKEIKKKAAILISAIKAHVMNICGLLHCAWLLRSCFRAACCRLWPARVLGHAEHVSLILCCKDNGQRHCQQFSLI